MTSATALFDLDGTLTDSRVGITTCIVRALEILGEPVPAEDALLRWIGPPLFDSFRAHLGSDDRAAEALSLYRERFADVGLFENSVYGGMPECLRDTLESCDRRFIVTSKPRVFAERIARHFELAGYFDGIYGSELDGSLTDKGDLIAHVLDRESIPARSAVMIGDRRHDVVGARRNRIRAIGVLWGFGSRSELEEAGADLICERVADLLATTPLTPALLRKCNSY